MASSCLLAANLPLILANGDRILENSRWFLCQLFAAFLSAPYMRGGPIPLGSLIELWGDGHLIVTCPNCDGRLHGIGIGGFILSGTHSLCGVCVECGSAEMVWRNRSAWEAIRPVAEKLKGVQVDPLGGLIAWRGGPQTAGAGNQTYLPSYETTRPLRLMELVDAFAVAGKGLRECVASQTSERFVSSSDLRRRR